MSFAYLPVNLGFSFGPTLGSQLVRLNLFYVFPAAYVYMGLGLFVPDIGRRQEALSEGQRRLDPGGNTLIAEPENKARKPP